MFYKIESINGEKITIDCSDDGTVVYSVGKRKTKFSLEGCSEYIFSSCDGTSQKIICGEDGVDQLTLIMLHGEERLERNNDERETDGHWRVEAMNDNSEYEADHRFNTEANALRLVDADNLRKAIRKLKPAEQELIHRLYLDDQPMSQAEYARLHGTTEKYIQVKARRTKDKLASILENK
jgi:hypothetical protein